MTMLIERYLAAALEGVPEDQRDEVAGEIRAAIDDMVERRVESGEPEAVATERALNELGDPSTLAASYEESQRSLIGPGWYPRYLELLRQLLTIVVPLIAVVTLVVGIAVDDKSLPDAIGDALRSVFSVAIQIAFWVTLGFAIVERVVGPNAPASRKQDWTVADLPEMPRRRQISLGDVAPDVIAMAVVAALAILQFTEGLGFFARGASDAIRDRALIDPDLGAGWVVGFFALVALSIVSPIMRYARGFWTRPMVVLETVDSVLWIGYIVALAASVPIVNPEVAERIDAGGDWWKAGGTANIVIAIVVIAISVQTALEAWSGYRDYQRQYQGIDRATERGDRWTV